MRTWAFNNNDAGHRGVWHLPTKPIEWEHVPAREERHEVELRQYHTDKCAGREQVVYDEPMRPSAGYQRVMVGCTCGLGDVNNVLRGSYTEIRHYPAFTKVKSNIEALCNQVEIYSSVYVDFPWNWKARQSYEVGSTHHATGTAKARTFTFEGDQPPGPVCSRCLRKAEKL